MTHEHCCSTQQTSYVGTHQIQQIQYENECETTVMICTQVPKRSDRNKKPIAVFFVIVLIHAHTATAEQMLRVQMWRTSWLWFWFDVARASGMLSSIITRNAEREKKGDGDVPRLRKQVDEDK